ncbi:hypothetical protein SEPCBS119000_004101 [Sporothrix epigloea]|uniref:Uncharacterized protein n=1 Tax=Sporothrix epigloea TaxID=1892477 RepID=A0ABP0DQH9_9PEZI
MASASLSIPGTPSERSALTSESFVMADPSVTTMLPPLLRDEVDELDDDEDGELDSLPSISTSVLSPSNAGTDDTSDAQREWEASLEQLQLMLTMVLVPFAGKYLGRKFAYWSWARYMEWAHDVEIRWTNKKAFKVAGAVGAAATL